MESHAAAAVRSALDAGTPGPLYLRLAEVLSHQLRVDREQLPPARELARSLGLNRATVTAAYHELVRQGLVVLRPGRPGRSINERLAVGPDEGDDAPTSTLDLARYAPDRELLPPGRVFRWLGRGRGEGDEVAQYGSAWGYAPLREWLAGRLTGLGVATSPAAVLLTSGVQHGLDLLLRALLRAGDTVMVEDPTYPGLPPLLALHRARAVALPVHADGVDPDEAAVLARKERPRLAILTPTLHNPTGLVLDRNRRERLLEVLGGLDVTVIEEFFDPALVSDTDVPPPLAALDPRVIGVGSFSKALFPGLRVGWATGPADVLDRVVAVKRSVDLSGSPFLEATAWTLCRRGVLDTQLTRLRQSSLRRRGLVGQELGKVPAGVWWTEPRGGFSLLLRLPAGRSSRAVAARAAELGVWVLPGPAISVSGRDDVVRLAFAAVGGERLRDGVRHLVDALSPTPPRLPLV